MTVTTEQETGENTSQRLSAVPVIFEALGAISAVATLLLGVLGTLPEHPAFEIGREVFGNVPDAVVVVFYLGVAGEKLPPFLLTRTRNHKFHSRKANQLRKASKWKSRVRHLS
jgi:hypothetical protein